MVPKGSYAQQLKIVSILLGRKDLPCLQRLSMQQNHG